MKRRHFSFFMFSFLLTGCAVGPDYVAPKIDFASTWFSPHTGAVNEESVKTEWWTIFGDPLLEKYIHATATGNKDVEIALANLRRARASRNEASASLWPQIGSDAQAERSQSSRKVTTSSTGSNAIRNFYDAGFDASWELDLFGGNRRSIEAAKAREESAVADYRAVMLASLSEVARLYYEARGLQKRISITDENSKLLKKTFELIEARYKAGEASEFDLSRARGEYQLTRSRLPNLRADLYATLFSLSVLLGQPPEAVLDEMEQVQPLPAPPDLVPVGLRSDILRRRPDIQRAERQLEAEVADIGSALSDLFPKFFLTGDAGRQARVFGDLFSSGSGVWSLGSLVSWPVFKGGALRAEVKVQEAESEAALATYHKAVLEAVADVETALTQYGQELETRKLLSEGVQSRRQSVELAQKLFDAGEQDYLAVLDAERELTASEDDLVTSETRSIVKLIALFTALGGGWEAFDEQRSETSMTPAKP